MSIDYEIFDHFEKQCNVEIGRLTDLNSRHLKSIAECSQWKDMSEASKIIMNDSESIRENQIRIEAEQSKLKMIKDIKRMLESD